MSGSIFVRADGGPDIGYGHLVRTSAIIEPLVDDGQSVTVVTTTPEAAESVFPDNTEILTIDDRADPDLFVPLLSRRFPSLVLADAYPVDTTYQRAVRELVPLAVVDDLAERPICADLVINANLYAEELTYEFIGEEPCRLLGPSYAPIRADIRTYANRVPPWRSTPQRALVTMGGSDVAEITPVALAAFDGVGIEVDVVVGPGFSAERENRIRRLTNQLEETVSVYRDPENLPELMFQADFAVCTASSTVYELLCLGTPFACVAVADNQKPIAAAIREQKLATVVEQQPTESSFRAAIQDIFSDKARRKRYRERGKELVDGLGVERISDKLYSLSRGNGS